MLIATFSNAEQAERAHDVVTNYSGYTDRSTSVLMSKKTRKEYFGEGERYETKKGTKAPEGAGIGGALGGTAGGIAGALAAVGSSIAIPGLGLVIAGPLAAALAGAGAGGGAGSLIGGLIGAGISEERAKRYKSDIQDGGVVLGVVPRNQEDAEHFEQEWSRLGADRIYYESAGGWTLFKAQLMETFDGLKSGELEAYRTDRTALETYIHHRTGRSQRDVSATIDEAASKLNYRVAPAAPAERPAERPAHAAGASAASAADSAQPAADSAQVSADAAQVSADATRTTEPASPATPPAERPASELAASESSVSESTASESTASEPRTPASEELPEATVATYNQAPEASSEEAFAEKETTHQAERAWPSFKVHLRETYDDLTDDDVERYKGQREPLIDHVQEKTGRSRSDVQAAVDDAASSARYSFRPVER